MNIKRALWVGFLTYIVLAIIGTLVIFLLAFLSIIEPTQTEIPNSVFLINTLINMLITVVLAVLFTLFYFKDRRITSNLKEGFLFGLVSVLLGFILNIIFFSFSSVFTGNQQDIVTYYSDPLLWIESVL